MYLEKLEIQGFKSFANKNILLFPKSKDVNKKSLTAVVGPNGSGKSNIADSVRWVLGEQSIKALRGKKGEDVIFSGSNKKGKLGLAEVSLFLNNENKTGQDINDPNSPLHYNQIVITRKLFRSGESEYLINNKKVRLLDIQLFLAKANFGQKTYSVIGQGLVENFLNTSPAERKDFFDEATGVKKFQIKRDSSLNKLQSSYSNLEQANLLILEIEPRLKILTRQVEKLRRRSEMEEKLKRVQLKYFSSIWKKLDKKLKGLNIELLDLEKRQREKESKLGKVNNTLKNLENNQLNNSSEGNIKLGLDKLRDQINDNNKLLIQIETKIEFSLEKSGNFDLSWLNKKQVELNSQSEKEIKKLSFLKSNLKQKKEDLELENTKDISLKIKEIDNQIFSFTPEKLELKIVVKDFWDKFKKLNLESDELKEEIEKLQNEFDENISSFFENEEKDNGVNKELEDLRKKLINLNSKKQEILNINQGKQLRIMADEQEIKIKEDTIIKLEKEIEDVVKKIDNEGKQEDISIFKEKREKLLKVKKELKSKEEIFLTEIQKIEDEDRGQKKQLFALQKEGQFLQNELNFQINNLNNTKIKIAKEETRLEDLEKDIRQEDLLIREIQDYKNSEEPDLDDLEKKINHYKRQLEIIGGIDEETEVEYVSTKERYDFLYKQGIDLEGSIKSLEKIVVELDEKIKKQFDLEFKTIDKEFNKYFKKLFNGGSAQLVRISNNEEEKNNKQKNKENDNIVEEEKFEEKKKVNFFKRHNIIGLAGIEIKACPPGKKINSISMLSGGERALTAIALICAIISANPAPFVFLDEVDAALDEANSEKLAQILDDLSYKTQFVTITHNRSSMRKAGLLYGVTMGDDGVSRLLSVKFDEVK
jgi:chromosome segregation protein